MEIKIRFWTDLRFAFRKLRNLGARDALNPVIPRISFIPSLHVSISLACVYNDATILLAYPISLCLTPWLIIKELMHRYTMMKMLQYYCTRSHTYKIHTSRTILHPDRVRRSAQHAHPLGTHVACSHPRPPVDRAGLVNLARGCNPGRLVSEWRHWRSLDGQLTPAPHPRVIGRYVVARRTRLLPRRKERNLLLNIESTSDVARG